MMYLRYGKFRFRDYAVSWLITGGFLALAVGCIVFAAEPYWAILPLGYAAILLGKIAASASERFTISNSEIHIQKWNKKRTIPLPSKVTLIVSYASPCSALPQTRSFKNMYYDVLPNTYAITMLVDTPLDQVFAFLHTPLVEKYTTSTIQTACPSYLYLYSFVSDNELFTQLLHEHDSTVVIPESLADKVSVDFGNATLRVDHGY